MKTKLTLSIDSDVVKHVKEYAKEKGTTVSEIVENLVINSTKKKIRKEDVVISPFVSSMLGVVNAVSLKEASDDEILNSRYEYLTQKHLK